MKILKEIRQRFGISAPRVAVHTHIAWYWRWLGIGFIMLMALALAWWAYDAGRKFAGFDQNTADKELGKLSDQAERLQRDNDSMRTQVAAAERQLQIERATHGDLAKQVKALGDENTRLKEDLAFFQNLTTAGGKEGSVSIYRFKVERDKLPGEYRYGLLLVQSGQRAKEFQGDLQFVVNLRQQGKKSVLIIPEDRKKTSQAYLVNFKYYQRIEGSFRVPPDAVLETLQVRVFASGAAEAKLIQTVNLS